MLTAPLLVPEIRLHLATAATELWRADERQAAALGLREPYWAFCWPGGQALARYVLDHPDLVRGRRVLDFGCGCGVVAIAAARSGASVLASDIDPLAVAATDLNAALNKVDLETTTADLVGVHDSWDLLLAGDMSYDTALVEACAPWFTRLVESGTSVLFADPGRGFLPSAGIRQVARYDAPADDDADGTRLVPTRIWRWGE